MRCEDATEMLEVRHPVAHRGRRQGHRQDARQVAGADRLARREVALDDRAEDLARALVQRRKRDLGCADRYVVGRQGDSSNRHRIDHCNGHIQAALPILDRNGRLPGTAADGSRMVALFTNGWRRALGALVVALYALCVMLPPAEPAPWTTAPKTEGAR